MREFRNDMRISAAAWRAAGAAILMSCTLLPLSSCGDDGLAGAPTVTPPEPTNEAPVAKARLGAAWTGIELLVGDTIELDGTQSGDPNSDPLSFTWWISSAPDASNPLIIDDDKPRALLSLVAAGSYTVNLTVTDPNGLSNSDHLMVSAVEPPEEPEVFENGPFDLEFLSWVEQPDDCTLATIVGGTSVFVTRNDPNISFEFDGGTLTGTIDSADHFVVQKSATFDWTDGCSWASSDTIEGDFSTMTTFQGTHEYREWTVTGTDCDNSCIVDSVPRGTRSSVP